MPLEEVWVLEPEETDWSLLSIEDVDDNPLATLGFGNGSNDDKRELVNKN